MNLNGRNAPELRDFNGHTGALFVFCHILYIDGRFTLFQRAKVADLASALDSTMIYHQIHMLTNERFPSFRLVCE